MSNSTLDQFVEKATQEDTVEIDISYDIIRHVSAQLYTNPRKAIEELVCNSYDAGATECWVSLPAKETEPLAVLDNGVGMNLEGIRQLWRIARSPKDREDGSERIENRRLQIGKFGVGKLAAFALGKRLTYYACRGEEVRGISVAQDEIREQGSGKRPMFAVFRAKLDDVKKTIQEHLGDAPAPWEREDEDGKPDSRWKNWTLALVEGIEQESTEKALKVGILKRMIRTALPISTDFTVRLDGELIEPRQLRPEDIEVSVAVTDLLFKEYIQNTLRAFWQDELGLDDPDQVDKSYFECSVGDMADPRNVEKRIPCLYVPHLGRVAGNAYMMETSLTTDKLRERGYSANGFAIYTHGKLVNPETPLFGITQRSHTYWSRFLAIVEIPELDNALLVQRNDVSEDRDETIVAREFVKALFNYTRSQAQAIEDKPAYKPKKYGARMRSLSPILSPMAIAGAAGEDPLEGGLEDLEVEFVTEGPSQPAARLAPDEAKILVNEEHPLVVALDALCGGKSKQMREVVGEMVAGNVLASGYLKVKGIPKDVIGDVEELMDVSLRSAASYVQDEVEERIKAIDDASHVGDRVFEDAVVDAFRSLRVAGQRIGGAAQPDGILQFDKAGSENLRVSVEAKGRKGIVTHADLSTSTVERHRERQGCQVAIAIAREFQVDGQGGEASALLQETRGKVTLLTTESIATILRLHARRPFTYDKIEEILTTPKLPAEQPAFIEEVWSSLPDLGLLRRILDAGYEIQQDDDTNLPSAGMIAYAMRRGGHPEDASRIMSILVAVQYATGMIRITNEASAEFKMLAHPDSIIEAMQRTPDGYESPLHDGRDLKVQN